MRLVIHLSQMLKIEVGIDLRCRDVLVSKQLLHRTQIIARFQHMGGKRVAQFMWADMTGNRLFFGPIRPCVFVHYGVKYGYRVWKQTAPFLRYPPIDCAI